MADCVSSYMRSFRFSVFSGKKHAPRERKLEHVSEPKSFHHRFPTNKFLDLLLLIMSIEVLVLQKCVFMCFLEQMDYLSC